jgi:hypothetical protein
MQSKYKQIIDYIRKGDVVLFIGAGFSIKAGAPSGRDLCDALYKALPSHIQEERSLKTEYTLQNISETYKTHYGRGALISLLQKAFNFEPKDTSDQAQLACIPQFKHIITTNYDSLIEDAYTGNCNLVVTNSDLSNIDSRKPTIYKVHGDFSHPDNIVITKNDYIRLYAQQQENLLWDSIRVEFSRHNVLFIGYSISDQNIQMLIEYVKKQMGNSAKRLFVLTPEVEDTALLQLKALGAEHIEGKAKDLFKELIPALKNHIVEDYEAKNTSVEDCDHFLREYDLQAGFELGGKNTPNRLIALRSVSGKDIQHMINLSLERNRTESLPYYDERFDNLPLRKIADVRGFEYRANDILIRRDDSKGTIYTYPIPKIGEICISIPQKQIIQKAPCRFYDNGFNQLQVDADTDIGILEILIPILPNREEGFRFRQKDRYTNNNTAIAWENLFSALFSGCQFSLTITSGDNISKNLTYAFPKSRLKQERKESKQVLQYYKYIREIELLMGCCFNEYENFSADNLFAAEIVYHYLKKEPLIIRHSSKGFEYKIEVPEITINPDVKKEFAFIESIQNVSCVLNGKEFKIPCMQRMYQKSILKSIKKNEKGNIVLQLIDKAKEHRIQLTDKPLQIETEEGIVEV